MLFGLLYFLKTSYSCQGRVKDQYLNGDQEDDEFSSSFHVRWLVDPKQLKDTRGFDPKCSGYYFCDWARQMVGVTPEHQVACTLGTDQYYTPKNGKSEPFKIFPHLYLFDADEIVQLEPIKNIFFEAPQYTDEVTEKRYLLFYFFSIFLVILTQTTKKGTAFSRKLRKQSRT